MQEQANVFLVLIQILLASSNAPRQCETLEGENFHGAAASWCSLKGVSK